MPSPHLHNYAVALALCCAASFCFNRPALADSADTANKKEYLRGQLAVINERIKQNPADAKLLAARAEAQSYLGNYEAAETDFIAAEALKADQDFLFLASRGSNYLCLKRYKEAIDTLTKAIALKPGESCSLVNRASAYYESGQYKEALTDCFKVIRLRSGSTSAHAIIGACYFKSQQYAYALQYLNMAIARQPKNFEALHYRGEVYQKLGKQTQAAQDFAAATAAGYAPGKWYIEGMD